MFFSLPNHGVPFYISKAKSAIRKRATEESKQRLRTHARVAINLCRKSNEGNRGLWKGKDWRALGYRDTIIRELTQFAAYCLRAAS